MGAHLELIPVRWLEYEPPSDCHDFGIGEIIAGVLGAGGLGLGAETAAAISPFIAGGLEGAAFGAGTSALTGGDPLKGALTGAFTGGAASGLGPIIGSATGIGSTAGSALAGGAAGAIGAEVTGGNPLTGAATGAAGGAISGALGGGETTPATVETASTGGTGGGTSAAAQSLAAPIKGVAPVDLSASDAFGLSSAGAGGDFGITPTLSAAPANINTPASTEFGDWSPRPASSGSSSGMFGRLGDKALGFIENNPGVLLGAGVLGANMLMGDKKLPGEAALQQSAGEAQTHARALAAYQESGTLPPGLQSVVDLQFNAAKGAVVDQYAKMGLGNSTMLADKLNQLKVEKSAQIAQFADMLAKQGISWANLSANEFAQLMNAQAQQDAAFNSALGSFAAGLAGMRSGSASRAA